MFVYVYTPRRTRVTCIYSGPFGTIIFSLFIFFARRAHACDAVYTANDSPVKTNNMNGMGEVGRRSKRTRNDTRRTDSVATERKQKDII